MTFWDGLLLAGFLSTSLALYIRFSKGFAELRAKIRFVEELMREDIKADHMLHATLERRLKELEQRDPINP